MIGHTPRSTRTYTLFPDTTLFRSALRQRCWLRVDRRVADMRHHQRFDAIVDQDLERCQLGRTNLVFLASINRQLQMRVGGHCTRSEEHTSELQSLMRISYAVFCLKQTNTDTICVINYPGTYD